MIICMNKKRVVWHRFQKATGLCVFQDHTCNCQLDIRVNHNRCMLSPCFVLDCPLVLVSGGAKSVLQLALFVFVLTGISSGGVSTWAKLADVEVIMTLKVLLSLARGVFPDLMCSVSWIRRTTSALGVGTYSMCGWRWKDGKMMWAVW